MAINNDFYPNGPMELPGEPEHLSTPHQPRRKRSVKKVLIPLLALAILAGLGFGAYTLFLKEDKAPVENSTAAPTAQTPTRTESREDVPDSAEKKTFKGDFPRVELTHPDNWTATETTDKGIRVESPEFSYKLVDGTTTSGQFRIYIRQGARENDSSYIGRAVAMAPSETLTYTEPAPSQRTETQLSFFGLDTSDNFAFFFVAGNFTLQKDETLGPSYGKEPETFIISGGYSAKTLADDMGTNMVSPETYNQSSAYKQALEIIKSLKIY